MSPPFSGDSLTDVHFRRTLLVFTGIGQINHIPVGDDNVTLSVEMKIETLVLQGFIVVDVTL